MSVMDEIERRFKAGETLTADVVAGYHVTKPVFFHAKRRMERRGRRFKRSPAPPGSTARYAYTLLPKEEARPPTMEQRVAAIEATLRHHNLRAPFKVPAPT